MSASGTATRRMMSGAGSARLSREARGSGKEGLSVARRARRMVLRFAVAILVLIEVIPLIWLLMSSLKTNAEFYTRSVWSLPEGFYLHNYALAFSSGMGLYLRNSAIATFPALIFILALSVAAAFALEIMRWRGRSLVLLLFLSGIFIPAQMILLPLFVIYFKLGLINNLLALIITYTAYGMPLSIFLLTAYYKSVPKEIVEAATVDGATIYRVFWRISLPMIRNAVVTVALVQFFFVWNDLLFSYTFISNANRLTVQTGLLSFVGQYGQISWGPTFAAVCIAVFPTLLIYLVLNQKIMTGLTAGSLKG
jgi:raffinose/stachyose/melibiose transport system permease protein